MAIDELLASDIGTQAASLLTSIQSHGGLIGPGSIIDLDALLANSPIKLHHLIYFGIIDHNDVRPLGDVDADALRESHIIDEGLLDRYTPAELVELGYLTIGDLIDLGQLGRADLANLPAADLDSFGFSRSIIEELDDLGLIVHGDGIALANLLAETNVTIADLLRFGLIEEGDLVVDLSPVLLGDLFVQGTVRRSSLLNSDVLELAAIESYVTQNAQGRNVVAVSDLVNHGMATLADLIHYGLLTALDFDLAAATVSENALLAAGLVTPNKLDNNNLVQDGSPDFVNVSDLVRLGLVTLEELAGTFTGADLHLQTSELYEADILAADVVGINVLDDAGLGQVHVDLEGLFGTGLVSEDDLLAAGLVNANDFWKTSIVTLRQLVDAGLVDAGDLTANGVVDLDVLLESDVVGEQYLADEGLDADGDGYVLIEDFLLDAYVTFAELVNRGLLRRDKFVNKVFEQSVLEAITVLNDEMELVSLFADGQLDGIVHLGTVGLDTLLGSILYDVTLAEYVAAEFVDVFDFENIDLTVADLEAEFAVDIDDAYVTTIPLHSLIALDLDAITLVALIDAEYVDAGDLASPAVQLDIVALERSDLFETGDLNNYISAHAIYLYDLIGEVFIGDLVTLGLLEVSDLIVRNLGQLETLVEDGVLDKTSFVDKTLSAAALNTSGLVTTADLNAFGLISGGNVSLQGLVTSGLVSLQQLIAAGFVDENDLAASALGIAVDRIHASDILDRALIEAHSLITGAENDKVFLNGPTSLLSTGIATLIELVKKQVVDPSHLAAGATIDKDDLVDASLADLGDLIDAGLIAAADIAPGASVFDLEELDRTGALPLAGLTSLDQMIALGLVTAAEVDGLDSLATYDLVASGLVTVNDLVDSGLLGTHVDLVALLDSGLVTIDALKAAGLDDRSGRVELEGLLDAVALGRYVSEICRAMGSCPLRWILPHWSIPGW